MNWPTSRVDELKAPDRHSCVGGPFGSELTRRDYVEEGVPVIRGVNLPHDQQFYDDEFVFVSDQKADQLYANSARPGDLVFTQRGTLGQVGLIPQEAKFPRYIISQSQMKLTVDPTKIIAKYAFYYFRQKRMVDLIARRAITSGVPHINLGILKSLDVAVPPPDVQAAIVEHLDVYSRAIENNRRRMELLEQSARLLFREWFVHLRYPAHEHDKIVDGTPEGWQRTTLASVTTKIGSGATPRGGESAYKTDGIALIRSQNVYDYRFEEAGLAFIDDEQADQLANVEVQAGDVLLNITGASVGRCCLVPSWCVPARVNQHVMIIRARKQDVNPYYLLCTLNSDSQKRYLLSVSSGGVSREALTK